MFWCPCVTAPQLYERAMGPAGKGKCMLYFLLLLALLVLSGAFDSVHASSAIQTVTLLPSRGASMLMLPQETSVYTSLSSACDIAYLIVLTFLLMSVRRKVRQAER